LKQIVDDESAVVNTKNAKILSQGAGLLSVKVSLTEISVVPKLNYSGVSEVIVELSSADTKETITVQVTVNPAGPSNATFTPTSPKLTSINWKASPSATAYEVKVKGSVVCTSKTSTCSVPQLLGPKAVISVRAIGNDRTTSAQVPADYANTKPVTALVVNFASGSSVLSAAAKSQLRAIAKTVVAQGFTHFVVGGHTDVRCCFNSKVLSLARAKVTYDYLTQYAPSLDVKLGAFASTKPAKPGKSAAAYAANRRAELGVY
jgi:outer membrane protein OmpA-like peptidoglycan-associated protein